MPPRVAATRVIKSAKEPVVPRAERERVLRDYLAPLGAVRQVDLTDGQAFGVAVGVRAWLCGPIVAERLTAAVAC